MASEAPSLASCWCPEEMGFAFQTTGEAYEKPLLTMDDLLTGWRNISNVI